MYRNFRRLFINKTSNIPSEELTHKAKPNVLNTLPDDIFKHRLFESLGTKESATAFVQTSKRSYQLFDQLKMARLTYHVTHGEQDQAEAILKKLKEVKKEVKDKKITANLLLQKVDMTDSSGRKFKKITVFQYALWALDTHMWEMLLKYFPPDETDSVSFNAREQLKELEQSGIEYQKPASPISESEIIRETHYDFSLINVLEIYLRKYNGWTVQERINYWCQVVGGAQRNLPMHVVNEYCHPLRSFKPNPDFHNDGSLPREYKFYNFYKGKLSSWFSDPGLGEKFAIWRGSLTKNPHPAKWLVPSALAWGSELPTLIALREARTEQFEMLRDKSLIPTHVSEPRLMQG